LILKYFLKQLYLTNDKNSLSNLVAGKNKEINQVLSLTFPWPWQPLHKFWTARAASQTEAIAFEQ